MRRDLAQPRHAGIAQLHLRVESARDGGDDDGFALLGEQFENALLGYQECIDSPDLLIQRPGDPFLHQWSRQSDRNRVDVVPVHPRNRGLACMNVEKRRNVFEQVAQEARVIAEEFDAVKRGVQRPVGH